MGVTRQRRQAGFENLGWRAYARRDARPYSVLCGMRVALALPMLRSRPVWMRGLRLYPALDGWPSGVDVDAGDDLLDARVHARSRFRSVGDPARFAVYTVHDADAWSPPTPQRPRGDHTLIVVREFRRVPLHASALALLLFHARPGHAAPVLAALAHFVERAVSVYQPAYLLLAHSLEQPGLSTLMLGVHECAALQAASATTFSVEALLPEVEPLLVERPEWYSYCPEPEAETVTSLVSPYAV
jgi:hypothetical protein